MIALDGFASAQKRTTTKRPVARPTPTQTARTLPPLDVRAARVKVDNQYFNVNKFIAFMDKNQVGQNIEAIENESRTRKVSKQSLDANQANKQAVLTTIKSLKIGLTALETEFKTKPILKMYLTRIQGISDIAAQSENLALAGKFVASVDSLRTIAQKLDDTLKAMPSAEL
jgi:hypothetical protein